MAEIKIEKKKPIWPWILIGLLILAVILYFFVFNKNVTDKAVNEPRDTTNVGMSAMPAAGDAVAEYVNFVKRDTVNMAKDHEYSHEALNKLADATDAVSTKTGVDVKSNLDEVKQLSQKITENPNATTHADDIKKAASIMSTALTTIQKAKFPDLNSASEKLMNDAKAIDTQDLTLDQKGTVKTFYNCAADLLQKMNGNY